MRMTGVMGMGTSTTTNSIKKWGVGVERGEGETGPLCMGKQRISRPNLHVILPGLGPPAPYCLHCFMLIRFLSGIV